MHENEEPDFTEVIAALAATFRQEATQAVYLGYWMGLRDLALEDVKRAAIRAMRTSKFMPAVAELRELAGEMLPEHRAVKAWAAFKEGLRQHGYYQSVSFDDGLINATVRNLGGWMPLLERLDSEEDEKWIRKDFEWVYKAFAISGIGHEQTRPLIGYCDAENQRNGYLEALGEPVKVITGLVPRREAIEGPAD
ncbi:hypothetical protein LCGC14_0839640 [marine sediment metagenome]|uniref:DUF6475 domain-containing protein n=1 Tax=marine sediment metagenome TaxID=412755 RepID=A0A0F9RY81_9ZZZZ